MSRSGLPEALHGAEKVLAGEDPNRPVMCQAQDCRGHRVRTEVIPGTSAPVGVFERAKADIYIRDKYGNLLAAVCQKCHYDRLVSLGKDQMSQFRETVSQSELVASPVESRLGNLASHVAEIVDAIPKTYESEDSLAERYAATGSRTSDFEP